MLTHTYYAQTYAGIIYLPLLTNWHVWHNNTLFWGMDTSTNPNSNFTWNRTQPLIDGGIIMILITPTIIKSWCSVSAHYCNHTHDLDCIVRCKTDCNEVTLIPPMICMHTHTRASHNYIVLIFCLPNKPGPLSLEIYAIYPLIGKIVILQVFCLHCHRRSLWQTLQQWKNLYSTVHVIVLYAKVTFVYSMHQIYS